MSTMKRYILYTLLVVPYATQASAQNYFEARNSAMGGAGVASSRYKAAPFANPALLTKHGEDDDFGFILPAFGVSADDKTDLSTDLEDFTNEFDRLEQEFSSGGAVSDDDLNGLATRLDDLDGRDLKANVGFGFTFAKPSDSLAWALHLKSYVDVTAFVDIAPDDLTAIRDANDPGNDFPEQLASNGRGMGVAVTEIGISLARKFEVSGMPLSIGITPKFQRVDTINYGINVDNYDADDIEGEDYRSDDGNFNLDIGASLEPGKGFVFGLVARDLIAADYESADSPLAATTGTPDSFVYEIGPTATVGAAWGNDWVTLAADFDLIGRKAIDESGTFLAANNIEDDLQFWNVGAEFDLLQWFQLRGGYRGEINGNMDNAVTAGFGLSPFDLFHIEVTGMYIDENSLGAVAQLSFTF